MGMGPEIAGGILGSAAGSALAPDSDFPMLTYSTPPFINDMNSMLDRSLQQAIQNSTGYTNQAIGQQNTSLNSAIQNLNTGLANATSAMTNTSNTGFNLAQALQSPYARIGANASDAYADSLGLSRPTQGSYLSSQQDYLKQQLAQAGQAGIFSGTAPEANTLQNALGKITQDQINAYLKANSKSLVSSGGQGYMAYTGVGSNGNTAFGQPNTYLDNNVLIRSNSDAVRNKLAQDYVTQNQSNYDNQLNQYNTQLSQHNQTQQNQLQLMNQYNSLFGGNT